MHLDVGRARKPPAASGYAVVRVGSSSVDGLNDAGIRKQLAPYSTARLLHLWTPYRRFSGRFTVKETMKDFAARAQHGLKPAPRLQFLVQHRGRLESRLPHFWLGVAQGRRQSLQAVTVELERQPWGA